MSDTVQASLNLSVNTTAITDNKQYDYTATLSGNFQSAGLQNITTDYAALTFTDVSATDYGPAVLHNTDAVNYIKYGSSNGEFTLLAGEFAHVRLTPGTSIYAKAPTAAVKLAKYLLGK